MSGGLRLRNETFLFSSKSSNLAVGTTVIVPTTALAQNGVAKVAIYRYRVCAIAAATYQFQDTSNAALSAIYSLAINQVDREIMASNHDYLWVASAAGLGLQIVVGGTGPVALDCWWGPAA